MRIKFVGAKPIVSHHGVGFDQSKPDRYTFLSPALHILETIESGTVKDDGSVDIREVDVAEYSSKKLLELLHKYCEDIEEATKENEAKTKVLIDELIESVKNKDNLTADDKRAYLGNIDIMKDYYLQYITNDLAYKCVLDKLANQLFKKHISKIIFPLSANLGLSLSHLELLLRDHKPPLDAKITIDRSDLEPYGIFTTGLQHHS